MIRRPPRSTRKESSAASDVYKRQIEAHPTGFEEAVNGSYYKSMLINGTSDGNASAVFIQSMGRYINDLEYRIESQ